MIGLSINEDLKLEKEKKKKKSSAGRSRVLLCGPHVTVKFYQVLPTKFCRFLPVP